MMYYLAVIKEVIITKESTSSRLKQIMEEKNIKQTDIINMSKPFQKKLGIKLGKSALSQYVNGFSKPNQDKLFLLSKTLNVSEGWLMGFDVPKKRDTDQSRTQGEIATASNIKPANVVYLPLIGTIACGEPITAEQNIDEYVATLNEGLPSGELFYLKAKGDSMEPKIPDGSKVLCRAQPDVESGEIAAVLVNGDEEATLKKVHKFNDHILLEAINEEYEPYLVDEEHPARIVGKAVGMNVIF